jgi:hypothetical protein
MAAVTELVDRLGMIQLLDAAIGPIKSRDRGFTGGQVLVGLACAQLVGEDFLVGLDRYRADVAGQVLAAVPGLSSTTAAGVARRFTDGQWRAVETAVGDVHTAMLALLLSRSGPRHCASKSRSTSTPPTSRSTGATSAGWRSTTRDSAAAVRTWPLGPRPRPCWPRT